MSLWEKLSSWSSVTKGLYRLNWSATDSSWNWNNWVASNVSYVPWRLWSQCAQFNWSNGYIYHPTFLDTWLTDWTVMFWMKTSTVQQGFLIDKTSSNYQYPFELLIGNDWKIALFLQRDNVYWRNIYQNNISINDWAWHFISLYWAWSSATSVYIWVDLVYQQNRTTLWTPTNSWSIWANSIYDFNIWRRWLWTNYFNWLIDEVIIENRVWTQQEIQKYYSYAKGRFWIL
jgi:hypothetical protein